MSLSHINKLLSKAKSFEWNKHNIEKNRKKHKIKFKECEEAFSKKPLILFQHKKHSITEKRFGVFGKTNNNKLLTIIFTFRNSKIRVISARKQSQKERKAYGQ